MIKEIMKIINHLLYNNTTSIDIYNLYSNILIALKESIKVIFKEDQLVYKNIQKYLHINYENENDFYEYISYKHLTEFPLYSSFLKYNNNSSNNDNKLDVDYSIFNTLTDEQISIFILCNHLSLNGIYLLLNDYVISIHNLKDISKDNLIWYCVFIIPEQRKRMSKKGNGLLLQYPSNILKRLNSDCNISYLLYEDFMLLSGRLTEYFQRYNNNNNNKNTENNLIIINDIDPILMNKRKETNNNNNEKKKKKKKYVIDSITEGIIDNISTSHVTYEYKIHYNNEEWDLYKRYNSFYV